MEEQIITVHVPKEQYRETSRTGQCANANDPISVCGRLCK